ARPSLARHGSGNLLHAMDADETVAPAHLIAGNPDYLRRTRTKPLPDFLLTSRVGSTGISAISTLPMLESRRPARSSKQGRYMPGESKTAVVGAIAAGVAIAITKFAVATLGKSSAMFSEGIHSTVDAANDSLLLLGLKR